MCIMGRKRPLHTLYELELFQPHQRYHVFYSFGGERTFYTLGLYKLHVNFWACTYMSHHRVGLGQTNPYIGSLEARV